MNEDNNVKTKKFSLLKLFIILLDVIAVIFIVFSYLYEKKNMQQEEVEDGTIYNFNEFSYNIPKDIRYEVIDINKFRLIGTEWNALVEVFIDYNNDIFNYPNSYQKALKDGGYKVDKYKKETISGEPVIIYNRHDTNNVVLCYLRGNEPYSYEIMLYNNDKSFNTSNLNRIVKVLSNASNNSEYDGIASYNELNMSYYK